MRDGVRLPISKVDEKTDNAMTGRALEALLAQSNEKHERQRQRKRKESEKQERGEREERQCTKAK